MNISEFKTDYEDMVGSVDRLKRLCDNTGNCVMNGFLGDSVKECHFDDNGILEFTSSRETDDMRTESVGAVLSDSILIKQKQNGEFTHYHNLYSWDEDSGRYTFLSFDNEGILNHAYDIIKRFDANLCSEDITTLFKNMGLTFDSVAQVLINQKVDSVSRMLDEELNNSSREDSFIL